MRCMVAVRDAGWAVLCSLTNKMQDMNQKRHISQVEPRNHRNSSIYITSSRVPLLSLFLLYDTHRRHPELSRNDVTCTKQRFSFQITPDNMHNFVLSLCASFHHMQLYRIANPLDDDSLLTHSDGTKGQPQRKTEG